MRVALLTAGSRGDTQPMTVLGCALQAQGHDVVVAASPNTLDMPERCGLRGQPLGPDSQLLMESESGQRWLAAGDVRAFTKELVALMHESWSDIVASSLSACADADVVVSGVLVEDLAEAIAQIAGTPMVSLHSFPLRRSRAMSHPMVTTRRLPAPLCSASGSLFEHVWWRGLQRDVNGYRASAGLPPARTPLARRRPSGSIELQAYDPVLVPDLGWTSDRPLTGFLTVSEDMRRALGEAGPDQELQSWLEAGAPPVFFGFGSMPVRDPRAAMETIRSVVRRLGLRALVSSGWSNLADELDDPTMRAVPAVDHDRLFPHCAAVVHHGGAGTLAAGLAAGCPTVVCSVFADQPFWGSRVEAAGVGAALPFQRLSAASLGAALEVALTPDCRQRADDLARRMTSGQTAVSRCVTAVLAAA